MARKDREEEGPRRRRKKGLKKPPAKTRKKKKNSPMVTLSIAVAVIVFVWAILPKDDDRGDSSKTVPAVVGILDQVYMGCTVYWYQRGSQNLCTQEIVDSLHSSKSEGIKVTVTSGEIKKFHATGKHIANRMVLFVDSKGDIFIKAKECAINIDSVDIADVNLEELEAQCTSGTIPPQSSS